MKTSWWGACGLAAATFACAATPALAARGDLNAYRVEATGKNLRALAEAGFDVTEGRDRKRGTVEVVGTRRRSPREGQRRGGRRRARPQQRRPLARR